MAGPSQPRLPSARDSSPWATCHDDPPAFRVARLQGTSCRCPPSRTGATPAGNALVAPGTDYARACKPVTEPDDHRNRESKRFGEPLAWPGVVRALHLP
jgi:hypothetical protein